MVKVGQGANGKSGARGKGQMVKVEQGANGKSGARGKW